MSEHKYLADGRVPIAAGDIVLNVGANIGEVATYLAGRGADVVAVEPDPAARLCLSANSAGMSIRIMPCGLWKADGPLTFFLATETADTSAINNTGKQVTVDAKTIDTLVQESGLESVHLIVGDAEGAEPEVLMGAARTLTTTDFVSLDCGYERRGERTFETCASMLVSSGFEILPGASPNYLLAQKRQGNR